VLKYAVFINERVFFDTAGRDRRFSGCKMQCADINNNNRLIQANFRRGTKIATMGTNIIT
jgi:hypothetical protein